MYPPPPATSQSLITAVILAGGRAQRMQGAAKGLLRLAGHTLIEHLIERLRPSVGELLINCNNLPPYRHFGLPLVSDLRPEQPGPLAGMEAGLTKATTPFVLFVPCDTPLLPVTLAPRMLDCLLEGEHSCVVAHDGERQQNGVLLIRQELLIPLTAYLEQNRRSVHGWLDEIGAGICDFSGESASFININTLEQLAAVEKMLEQSHG